MRGPAVLPPDAKIFLVDDDPHYLQALAAMLRAEGVTAEAFSAPASLLSRLQPPGPDCIVTDLHMPGLDGLQLQAALAERGLEVPLVFVSGMANLAQGVSAMRAGAVDFLEKPVYRFQLVAAVGKALEQGRRAREARAARDQAREALDRLTPRERDVCRHVARGLLNKQIAGELGISEHMVKVHRGKALEKLGCESVPDLVRLLDQAAGPAAPPAPAP